MGKRTRRAERVPSGAFEDTPLIDIAFEDGKVVVKTPPVVNSDGVTVSVVESSDVAGKTVTATKAVDATGSTEFDKSAESPRFYRLSADVTEQNPVRRRQMEFLEPKSRQKFPNETFGDF